MVEKTLIRIEHLTKRFGDFAAVDDVSLEIREGEFFALLGLLTLHSFFNDELSWHAPLLYFAILGYAEFVRVQRKAEHRYAPMER